MCAKMPKYAELYSRLRQSILLGEYPAGTFLPTENELSDTYNVSKTTVRHAVKMLKSHNLVEVRQGSGTKILPTMEQEPVIRAKYGNPGSSTSITVHYSTHGSGEIHNTRAVVDVIPASETVASALKIMPKDPVYRLQRLQLVDGIPFGYMVNYLSQAAVPELSSTGEMITDLYGHLRRCYGITVMEVSETIDAITAGFMEAQFLQVEISTPLIVLKRIAREGPHAIEYCETTVRPDIFHMTVQVDNPGNAGSEKLH